MRIVLAVALLLAGCTRKNPNYCEGEGCPDAPPQSCTASSSTCVCKDPPGICVPCTPEDERNCSGKTPQCGDDNRCRACRSNTDCDSGACLEDGSCADPSQVIYAAPNGVNTAGCGQAAGQNECSLAQALIEIAPPRDIIRLAPGPYGVTGGVDGVDFSAKSATVIARGATLTRSASDGAIMSVRNSKTLKLVGGTLRGPNNDDGLKCNTGGKLIVHETTIERMTQSGIESDACELTVSRATIRNNVEGGINMTNTPRVARITNNFIYRNGGAGSSIGGMVLRVEPVGSKVEFNTIVDNDANLNVGTAGGIACEGNGYDALYNLVYRNEGGLGGKVQVIGTCTFQGSYRQEAMTPDENAVGFDNPNDAANPSFRLTTASPPGTIRDAFDCTDVDFEGDPRPTPSAAMGGKCDYGADEYQPPP